VRVEQLRVEVVHPDVVLEVRQAGAVGEVGQHLVAGVHVALVVVHDGERLLRVLVLARHDVQLLDLGLHVLRRGEAVAGTQVEHRQVPRLRDLAVLAALEPATGARREEGETGDDDGHGPRPADGGPGPAQEAVAWPNRARCRSRSERSARAAASISCWTARMSAAPSRVASARGSSSESDSVPATSTTWSRDGSSERVTARVMRSPTSSRRSPVWSSRVAAVSSVTWDDTAWSRRVVVAATSRTASPMRRSAPSRRCSVDWWRDCAALSA